MHTLITGANRGIGAALLSEMAGSGDVVGTSRDGSVGLTLNVTKPNDLAALGAAYADKPLDLLVCNAGVYFDKGQTLEDGFAPELWADTFATNVTGVFLTIQTLLPAIRAAQGRIAIISSQMGSSERAGGSSYIYRASKAAALNLGRNLAVDLKPQGIAVGIYHPGWVRTDMGSQSADISVEQSAAGLAKRFAALSLDTTGCFEFHDGAPIPF